MKKHELEARCAALSKDNTLLSYAVSVLSAKDKPVHVERWRGKDSGERYQAAVYYPQAAHGGFVVVTFTYPGQRDGISVHYAEEWVRDTRERALALHDTDLGVAADHVRAALHYTQQPATTGTLVDRFA